jgi:flagellar hook assembly protein FlgD
MDFTLEQNYPNPFNPSTEIRFSLTRRAQVRLEVFDPTGRLVTTLLNRSLGAGEHTATWDGADYASGVYLYRLTVGDQSDSKKMVLVK